MNLDLCLIACLFDKKLSKRFEEDEKDILMTIAKLSAFTCSQETD